MVKFLVLSVAAILVLASCPSDKEEVKGEVCVKYHKGFSGSDLNQSFDQPAPSLPAEPHAPSASELVAAQYMPRLGPYGNYYDDDGNIVPDPNLNFIPPSQPVTDTRQTSQLDQSAPLLPALPPPASASELVAAQYTGSVSPQVAQAMVKNPDLPITVGASSQGSYLSGLPKAPAYFDGKASWVESGRNPDDYNPGQKDAMWARTVHSHLLAYQRQYESLGYDADTAQKKAVRQVIAINSDSASSLGYTVHNDQDQIYDPLNLYADTQYSSVPSGDSATKKLKDFKEIFTSRYINDKTDVERPWLASKTKDQFWQEYLARNGLNEDITVDQYMKRLRASDKISNN